MAREVRVAILGDSRDYNRAVDSAVRDSDRLDRSFRDTSSSADRSFRGIGESANRMKAVVATAAVGATIALGGFVVSAIRSASNLQETVSLTNQVFGDVAPFVQNWAKGAARGFGQSRQAALRTAGAFGNLFRQTGFTNVRAANLSMTMTELASDFASFHNADTVQVTEAMSAAFRGEYDALQRFVPLINAAAVEQEALRQTGKEHAEDLTAEEKALATYTLMIEGAGDAMGDFDRTSGGLANQQRILGAQWEDLKAQIGEKFLPVATEVVTWLNDKLPAAFTTAGDFMEDVGDGWDILTTKLFGEGEGGWDDLVARHETGWQEFQRLYDDYITNLGLGWDAFTTKIFGEGESGWDDVITRHNAGWQEFQRLWDNFSDDIVRGWDEVQGKWDAFTGHIALGWQTLMHRIDEYTEPFITSIGLLVDAIGAVKDALNIGQGVDQSQILPPGTGRTAGPALPRPGEIPTPTVPRSENSYAQWMAGYTNPELLRPLSGFGFAEGGIVPGLRGAPRLALVHAGETILPTHTNSGAGGQAITINVNGDMSRETGDEIVARLGWMLTSRGDG